MRESVRRLCRARGLWLWSRWTNSFQMRCMDSQDTEHVLAYFNNNDMNPVEDDEMDVIVDSFPMTGSDMDEAHSHANDSHQMRDIVLTLQLLDEQLNDKRMPDMDGDKKAPSPMKDGQQAELAMLWHTLNTLVSLDEDDAVSPLVLFFQDMLDGIITCPRLSLSSVWTQRGEPGSGVCLLAGAHPNMDRGDGLLKATADEELRALITSAYPSSNGICDDEYEANARFSRHDPTGLVQNLFTLSESQLITCLFHYQGACTY
jgi:hypothetical protein